MFLYHVFIHFLSLSLFPPISMVPEVAHAAATSAIWAVNFPIVMVMMIAPSIAALAIGLIGARSVEAVGRNPEAASKIQTITILTAAFSEAIAIYCLVVALILKFVQ